MSWKTFAFFHNIRVSFRTNFEIFLSGPVENLKTNRKIIEKPAFERFEFKMGFGGYSILQQSPWKTCYLGPLLLIWFNFNPSMDK